MRVGQIFARVDSEKSDKKTTEQWEPPMTDMRQCFPEELGFALSLEG